MKSKFFKSALALTSALSLSGINMFSAVAKNLDTTGLETEYEMLELETLGFLEKTHTSSGRIPSTVGYRYYVEHLMIEKIDNNLQTTLFDNN